MKFSLPKKIAKIYTSDFT